MKDATKAKLTELGNKIGYSFDTMSKEYDVMMKMVKQYYPTWTADQQEDRARQLVYAKHTEALRSQSAAIEFVAFYIGENVDFSARQRELALNSYAANESQAIASGLISDGSNGIAKGTPLDVREWMVEPQPGVPGRKNPNFRKALQPFFQRTVLGFCNRFGDKNLKLFIGTMREDCAQNPPEKNKAYVARFNVKSEDANVITATSGRKTDFKQFSANPAYAGWNDAKTMEMLANAPIKTPLGNLEGAIESNKNAIVIIEADLISKSPEPSARGSYNIRIGNIEDFEGSTQTVFIDANDYAKIETLGAGTKLIIIGRLSKGNDLLTGTRTAVLVNALMLMVTLPVKSEELSFDQVEYKA